MSYSLAILRITIDSRLIFLLCVLFGIASGVIIFAKALGCYIVPSLYYSFFFLLGFVIGLPFIYVLNSETFQ
uniref:Uncharacterized protein n=1 Tax=Rhizophora mucronata TaxID=61149 RepID=A0A2P2Q2T4_RHIMU